MTKKTQDIQDLTSDALYSIPKPWPDYITFLVFLAIEHNESFYERYQMLVEKYDQIHGDGAGHLNTTIPKIVINLTGRHVIKKGNPAKSRLIATYSKLG